jgi:hypothetical protein
MPPPGETEQQVIRWNDAVRQTGVIRLFVEAGLRRGGWAGLVDKAIVALNGELASKGIGVAIKQVARAADAEAILDTRPGIELHGQSFLDTNGTPFLQRVTIQVPATPKVSKQYKDAREAGPGVRLYMIAHELIHTLGLTNAAHSRDDVFTRNPGLLTKGMVLEGKGITEDVIRSYDLSAIIPPIRLGAATIANLQKAWPAP